MKVLHTPIEIAGQAGLSVKGLREIGIEADSLCDKNPFGYKNDYYYLESDNREERINDKELKVKFISENYDIIHYHFGSYLLPGFKDVEIFKSQGKKLFVEFWGSDVRLPSVESKRNPYFINAKNTIEEVNIERMKKWSEYMDGEVIFGDHTFNVFLKPYFDKIHIVGQRVDTKNNIPVYPSLSDDKEVVVVHAPSFAPIKGTKYVEEAIEKLKAKGLKFKYVRVENMPNHLAMEIYKTADIIIDQLCLGGYGIFASEAMSLGKPVICYILEEHLEGYPEGMPIINANPDTIEKVLEFWINSPAIDRYNVGVKSRRYVEKVHDIQVVAKKLEKIYLED